MKIRHAGKTWDVDLEDDGTMDTVISVDGKETRYDGEYASSGRDRDGAMTARGLRALAVEAIDDGCLDDDEV